MPPSGGIALLASAEAPCSINVHRSKGRPQFDHSVTKPPNFFPIDIARFLGVMNLARRLLPYF
ncbi:hypothetical protein [Rhizobium leucaenae]|uniref:hypothetical protein n=1 Tax=Rhizobium leucaenae TaxID=29450 RepID=UPI001560FECD|nr:hypothetical protein [Rhizobium leucaenae]MBB6302110.1 hypothetical protein [Rhizobium leucaenae]